MKLGKIKFFTICFYLFFFYLNTYASQKTSNLEGDFIEIKILDKVSSKNSNLILMFLGLIKKK